MTITNKPILLSLILLIQSLGIIAQSPEKASLKKIDSLFTSYYDNNSPGAAFALIKEGEVLYKKTIGLANMEYKLPITDTSVFNIASNSKQMSTWLACLLEEEGKLSFSDDVRTYLPELKHLPYKISLKQLTNHTHGLANVDELAKLKGIQRMRHEEVLAMLFEITQVNFKPGEEFQYNNTGYVLLSEIIARVGGKPFPQLLKEKIFAKLGMNHSQAVGHYDQVIPLKAFSMRNGGLTHDPVLISRMGASGVYASLHDMIVWIQNLAKNEAKQQQYLEKMLKTTQLNKGQIINYGMGLQFENYQGIDIIFHGGGMGSYRSYILHAPAHQLSMVFLSNAGGFTGYDLVYKTLEIILAHAIEKPQPRKQIDDLTAYEGTYELTPASYFTIWAEGDSLYVKTFGVDEKIVLPRLGKGVFKFPLPHAKIIFQENGFDLRWVDFTYHAKRIKRPRVKDNSLDLSKYVGSYSNEAHHCTFDILLLDGRLVARGSHQQDFKLDFYADNTFYANNSPFGRLTFFYAPDGKVKGFKLSRQNIRNLNFIKTSACP